MGFEVFDSDGCCLVHNRAIVELFGMDLPADYNVFRDNLAKAAGYTTVIRRVDTSSLLAQLSNVLPKRAG